MTFDWGVFWMAVGALAAVATAAWAIWWGVCRWVGGRMDKVQADAGAAIQRVEEKASAAIADATKALRESDAEHRKAIADVEDRLNSRVDECHHRINETRKEMVTHTDVDRIVSMVTRVEAGVAQLGQRIDSFMQEMTRHMLGSGKGKG